MRMDRFDLYITMRLKCIVDGLCHDRHFMKKPIPERRLQKVQFLEDLKARLRSELEKLLEKEGQI